MTAAPLIDPIIRRFHGALVDMYGDRLDRVVLFGSRARGAADPQSDYDVAVFLTSLPDRWAEFDRLAQLRLEFLDHTGAFFDANPFPSTAYSERTPLMREVRREGIEV